MIKNLLIIFCILITQVIFSQENFLKKIDSLETALHNSKPDTTKVNLYNIASQYYNAMGNQEKALSYNTSALNLSTKLKWGKGITNTYYFFAANNLKNTERSRFYLLKALDAAKKYDERKTAAAIYTLLANNIIDKDFKKAITYRKDALSIYKTLNDNKNYRLQLRNIAGIYSIKGMYYEAADNYMKAITMAERAKDTNDIIDGYRTLALMYKLKGDGKKALNYYLKLLPVLQTTTANKAFLAEVHREIGDLYYNSQNYNEALKHFKKSYGYANRSLEQVTSLIRISKVYSSANDTTNAESNINKAITLTNNEADAFSKMYNYISVAQEEYEMRKYNEALKHCNIALQISAQFGDLAQQPQLLKLESLAKANMGACYFMLANKPGTNKNQLLKESISFLEQSIATFKMLNNLNELSIYSKQLSDAYELLGEHAKAFSNYKDYIVYRDSLTSIAKEEQFSKRESEYEYGKKESLLKAKQQIAIEKEQANRNYAFAGVGILVLVSGGAGAAYARKRKDNRIIAHEKKRSDDLLLNILPAEVAEELKTGGEAHAQQHGEVSILFTDFVGFTKLSENLSPTEIIAELNYCFKAFDRITTKYNIEKIKTIGDSYMAVSGLPTATPNHAVNAVKAALEIRDFIIAYKEQRELQGKIFFEMRIGINSGEVVAGIVGIKKFAYDIWGDAVNIASRMETNGQPGKVNISESTYNLVKDHYDTEYRGELDAKGKGLVKMYFAESKS